MKIGMFVWNHFTNDARVLRECTALVENGYNVDLIAIDDPKDPNVKRFEKINGFNVIRVNRYPKHLVYTKKVLSLIKENKILTLPLVIFLLISFYYLPIITSLIMLYLITICYSKSRSILIKLHIIINMIF